MNPSDEKGQVKLTARGSQAKRTKFHSELLRRHLISYQMLTGHLSLHKSMITPIQKTSLALKHTIPESKKISKFQRLFCKLQVQWWQWWCLPTAAW